MDRKTLKTAAARLMIGKCSSFIGLIVVIFSLTESLGFQDNTSPPPAPLPKIIQLDRQGSRGVVSFNHKTHELVVHQGPDVPFKTKAGATCAGCHHTVSPVRGVPQLRKCTACHREDGNPQNPKNKDFDELRSERAFHDLCISCHRASNKVASNQKSPTTCGECHKIALNGHLLDKHSGRDYFFKSSIAGWGKELLLSGGSFGY